MKRVFSLFGRLMMGDCAADLLLDSTQGIPALTYLPSVFLRPRINIYTYRILDSRHPSPRQDYMPHAKAFGNYNRDG